MTHGMAVSPSSYARNDGWGSLARRGYWASTAVVVAAFVIPGIGNLVRVPHIAEDMAHLGYPSYFLVVLGIWKILGAVTVAVPGLPRLKEWAYAGMLFDLTGAAASRLAVGDGVVKTVVPLLIAAVVMTSWALRPEARKLARRDAQA